MGFCKISNYRPSAAPSRGAEGSPEATISGILLSKCRLNPIITSTAVCALGNLKSDSTRSGHLLPAFVVQSPISSSADAPPNTSYSNRSMIPRSRNIRLDRLPPARSWFRSQLTALRNLFSFYPAPPPRQVPAKRQHRQSAWKILTRCDRARHSTRMRSS